MTEDLVTLTPDTAHDLTCCAMRGAGLPADEASIVADHLVDASLRGYPAYGINRVIELTTIVRDMRTEALSIQRRDGATAVLDGGGHIGYVVGRAAITTAIDVAAEFGVGVVAAHNTFFTGLLSYYCELAADQGFVSIVTSSNEALVAPTGGREARLGTNPIAMGFPNGREPVIWDVGTSSITRGEVWMHARTGTPLPSGLAIDAAGDLTTDAVAALGGAILPWGGHRGSGLSVMIQLLGLLAGAPDVGSRQVGRNSALLCIVIDPQRLGDADDLARRTVRFAEYLRSTPPLGDQPVRLPFDRSRRQRALACRQGLKMSDTMYRQLLELAALGGFHER